MIMLANQVRQIKAKKVPIQKSRQLVIFSSFPVGSYSVKFVLFMTFDFFEIFDEKIEVCCKFNVVSPDSVFFLVVFDDVFHV